MQVDEVVISKKQKKKKKTNGEKPKVSRNRGSSVNLNTWLNSLTDQQKAMLFQAAQQSAIIIQPDRSISGKDARRYAKQLHDILALMLGAVMRLKKGPPTGQVKEYIEPILDNLQTSLQSIIDMAESLSDDDPELRNLVIEVEGASKLFNLILAHLAYV